MSKLQFILPFYIGVAFIATVGFGFVWAEFKSKAKENEYTRYVYRDTSNCTAPHTRVPRHSI